MDYYELDDPADASADQYDGPYIDGDQQHSANNIDPLPDDEEQTGSPHGRAVWVDTDGDGDYDKRLVDRDGDGDWDNLSPADDDGGRRR